ncbi:TfoX/Sxy family protein [Chelatococcus sp. GW1]|uniref:TfoX/Sxy family protein n=1 Tax=Chelatococcus sp. GW1 TaxID=1211115 RepID=UPI0002EE4972|nr:TfoX/Sxy family protein [Chelatococcus sp. GW1]
MRDADDIAELFAPFRPVGIRRMFGGLGIYAEGKMFALAVDGEVYLKTDAAFAEALGHLGSRPVAYARKDGRVVTLSYWLLPDAAYDEPDMLADLSARALSIAGARP